MQDAGYKRCRKCGETKSRTEYSAHKGCADGLRPECRACISAYNAAYRATNAAKVKADKKAYYDRTADERNAKKRKPCGRCGGPKPPGARRRYCDACAALAAAEERDRARLAAGAWYESNRERTAERNRQRRKSDPEFVRAADERARAWREANWERHREQAARRRREWRAANPDRAKELSHRRSARVRAAFIEDVNPLVLLELDDGVCGICHDDVDPFDFHIDHIIPLARGGSHSYANTQAAHPRCNVKKQARMPDEYAA